jgi:hypothetical protein
MSEEVETYLKSGDHDPKFEAWPGSGFFDRSQNGSNALREALVAEVLAKNAASFCHCASRRSGSSPVHTPEIQWHGEGAFPQD